MAFVRTSQSIANYFLPLIAALYFSYYLLLEVLMKYVCYELDEDSELSMNWYERIGNAIDKKKIASTNPDFHEAYNNVIYWWLELTAGDIPVRELGFDCNGEVIVAGPLGKNMGLFTYLRFK